MITEETRTNMLSANILVTEHKSKTESESVKEGLEDLLVYSK